MIDPKRIVERVNSLAPLPGTAIRLMSVINDPHSAMEDIIECVRYDQAVTSAVLRICNSAFSGLQRRISSIHEALTYVGTAKLVQLVMGVHARSLFTGEQKGYGLAPGVLWRHSVAVALASAEFARRIKLPDEHTAYTAGLLHGIGKMVLNEYVADEFARILELVSNEGRSFNEAETEVIGFSHEEIGAVVADHWRLPPVIVRCIRYHHQPGALDPPDPFVDVVYLASCVCLMMGIGLGEDGLCYRTDARVLARHGLHEQDMERVGIEVLSELGRLQDIFLDSPVAARGASPARTP